MQSIKLPARIEAFCALGTVIKALGLSDRKDVAEKARNENPWFTEDSVALALKGIETLLEKDGLNSWATSYSTEPAVPKTIGVAMAGNIPLVGFHDFLCVLISGHRLKAKLSSQDSVLLKFIWQKLVEIEPQFLGYFSAEENLKGVDAMIATGSDNTARYFEYYFRKIPHVIRKNRASCAVIVGEEPRGELELLGKDVFSYFGLGCRNVSKLYVPAKFEFRNLFESWQNFGAVIDHHKYGNNYDYQKSILLLNQESFLDNGFILVKESGNLVSPIATLYYEEYNSQEDLKEKIEIQRQKLQVVVSAQGWYSSSVPFGKAQLPNVTEYSDNVDTMNFLRSLK